MAKPYRAKVSFLMRFRVPGSLRWLCLLITCAVVQLAGHLADGQIRLNPPAANPSEARPEHADAGLLPTTVNLFLCVDDSTTDTCPTPITNDDTYIPAITYTYGQLLDGLVEAVITGTNISPGQGTLTISANGTVFCTLASDMSGACPPLSTVFDVGTYTIVAMFSGNTEYAASTSLPVVVTVEQDSVSSLTLTSSLNPAPLGSTVTFTAKASAEYSAIPTGQVTFIADGNSLGPAVALDGTGTAQLSTAALTLGTHTIVASYLGSQDFMAAEASPYQQVISPPGTKTTIASSLNPSVIGENVTFTADVTALAGGARPTGSVSFDDGTKTFATVVVSAQGGAQSTISTLAGGSHNITANYSGDVATAASVSPVLIQQVNYPLTEAAPGYTITVTPSPVVIGVGLTANLTVVVTPKGGFSSPVTLACGSLPNETTCTFGQTVIPAGGGTTILDLTTMAPHDCGSMTPYFVGANRPGSGVWHGLRYGGAALASILILVFPRHRGRGRFGRGKLLGLGFILGLGLGGLSGCSSHCTDFGTYPGNYTFIVTGTAPANATTPVITGTPLTGTVNVQTSVALSVTL